MFNNTEYTTISKDSNETANWIAKDSTQAGLKGKGAKRIYYEADAQVTIKSNLGATTLRAEYVFGQQPGTAFTSVSPAFEPKTATYLRQFKGFSIVFVQRIAKTKHEIALKYSCYDPNTKVSGNDLGQGGFGTTDLKYTDLGLGYINYFNDHIKFMIYYNIVTNEATTHINGYSKDLKDNVLTLRMQVRF